MDRWYALAVVTFILVVFGSSTIEKYFNGKCKIEAIKAGKSTQDIEKLCI